MREGNLDTGGIERALGDLERINYIDSTGIGELVGYLGRFSEARRRLILVAPSERVQRLLRVVQLDSLFPTYETLEAALAAEQA